MSLEQISARICVNLRLVSLLFAPTGVLSFAVSPLLPAPLPPELFLCSVPFLVQAVHPVF
jgi:hypothetical protein